MILSRCIAIVLSLVLAVVAVPAAGACPMGNASTDHVSAHFDAEPEHCHEPAADDSTPLAQDCPDCFEHCPAQAHAAVLPGARHKIAEISRSMLPYPGGVEPVAMSTRPFRPPSSVPLAHSHNT